MSKVREPPHVFGHARRPTAPRCGTPTLFAASLQGRVLDSVYLTVVVSEYVSRKTLRYRPTTSAVSPCAPATILGLRFKQDTCIVGPQNVCSYVNQSRSSFDFLLLEIALQ